MGISVGKISKICQNRQKLEKIEILLIVGNCITTGFWLTQKAGAILYQFEMPWPAFRAVDPSEPRGKMSS